jgi:murein DD-endopeptidase MepM/ murein hydrolase activator NlpD
VTDIIVSFLLPAALKGSLVCVGVLLATLLLRKTAPSLKHLLLFLAISSFILVPILQLALPSVRVPYRLPGFAVMDTADSSAGSAVSAAARADATAGLSPGAAASSTQFPVKHALLLFWAAGALVLAGRSLIAIGLLRRLRRMAFPLDGPCADAAERMVASTIPNRQVRIRRTSLSDVPLTLGILRPVVLLPAAMLADERETFAPVLAHELAHVKRRDVLTGRIAYLICCLFWFAPFAWLVLFRLRVEQEKSCDLVAMKTAMARSRYAEILLWLRASMVRPPLLARFSAQVGGERALEERIKNILNHDERRIRMTKRIVSIILMAVCALIVPLSITRCAPSSAATAALLTKDISAAAGSFAPVWPLASKAGEARIGSITNAYGPSTNPITKSDYNHTGIDIAWRFGTPVIASAEGVVAETGSTDERGRYVVLRHANGYTTSYSHLEAIQVEKGDPVRQGQAIGSLGSTGFATGPHLHYEITDGGEWVDPLPYLDAPATGARVK